MTSRAAPLASCLRLVDRASHGRPSQICQWSIERARPVVELDGVGGSTAGIRPLKASCAIRTVSVAAAVRQRL